MRPTSGGFNKGSRDGISLTPAPTTDSWWVGLSPDPFYAEAHRRHVDLSRKYGSAPVATAGKLEPGFNERARLAKARSRREQGYV